jgi:hypothetical protein
MDSLPPDGDMLFSPDTSRVLLVCLSLTAFLSFASNSTFPRSNMIHFVSRYIKFLSQGNREQHKPSPFDLAGTGSSSSSSSSSRIKRPLQFTYQLPSLPVLTPPIAIGEHLLGSPPNRRDHT